MAKEAVEKIRQAETTAAEREKQATADAQKCIADARLKASEIINAALEKQKKISEQEISTAEQAAQDVLNNVKNETRIESETVRKAAETRQGELNAAVLNLITS